MDLNIQQQISNKLNKRPKKIGKGYLYLIKSGIYYKIGIASNLSSRLNTLQCGNPNKLTLIARAYSFFPKDDEKRFHNLLRDYRVRGEWFELPTILVSSLVSDFYQHNKEYVRN